MFIERLKNKELFYQSSNESVKINKIYSGFDLTAKSLQIGNLIPIITLKEAEKEGITPIILLGGATSTIGDPSEKTTTRKQLATKEIEENYIKIENQIKKLIPNTIIVNNAAWLNELKFMDFLEKVAGYISTASIIKLTTFENRLKNNDPLSIKEILYPLMQGYDFLWLYENYECNAQIGGQDQWCNILPGTDLIKRKHHNDNVSAITFPLLTNSDGKKMGKSEKGAIYLNPDLCSIYDFWQFWRNVSDDLVYSLIKKFTNLEIDIKKEINELKIDLANEMTTWVHSKEEAKAAANNAKNIFLNKNYNDLKIIETEKIKLSEIISFLKNISSSESKKLIQNKGIKVNNQVIEDITTILNQETYIIQIGKKEIFKIKIKNYS